jgi:3-ketosteroid 9alpha-monooxygenase subunit A
MLNTDYAPARHSGWYLATTTAELQAPITPLNIAGRALMAVATGDGGYRVYDSVCPHRGASLAHGGTVGRAGVICPFHGRAIALGSCSDPDRYSVAEVPSLLVGTVLFVCVSGGVVGASGGSGDGANGVRGDGFKVDGVRVDDRGFEATMLELASTHDLFPCPPMTIDVAPELVVENAFDLDHFMKVHHISRVTGMDWGLTENGPAHCHAEFTVRTPQWEGGGPKIIQNRFYTRAFSPTVVVTELGEHGVGQTVITGATRTPQGCVVRVVNALRRAPEGPASEVVVRSLTDFAAKALHDDMLIWEHLDTTMTPQMDRRDAPVVVFREFCDSFQPTTVDRVLV